MQAKSKKRPGIPWNNFCMRKYGESIKKQIVFAHLPFQRILFAKKLIEKAALMSVPPTTDTKH